MMGVFHLTKQIYVGIFCNCTDIGQALSLVVQITSGLCYVMNYIV